MATPSSAAMPAYQKMPTSMAYLPQYGQQRSYGVPSGFTTAAPVYSSYAGSPTPYSPTTMPYAQAKYTAAAPYTARTAYTAPKVVTQADVKEGIPAQPTQAAPRTYTNPQGAVYKVSAPVPYGAYQAGNGAYQAAAATSYVMKAGTPTAYKPYQGSAGYPTYRTSYGMPATSMYSSPYYGQGVPVPVSSVSVKPVLQSQLLVKPVNQAPAARIQEAPGCNLQEDKSRMEEMAKALASAAAAAAAESPGIANGLAEAAEALLKGSAAGVNTSAAGSQGLKDAGAAVSSKNSAAAAALHHAADAVQGKEHKPVEPASESLLTRVEHVVERVVDAGEELVTGGTAGGVAGRLARAGFDAAPKAEEPAYEDQQGQQYDTQPEQEMQQPIEAEEPAYEDQQGQQYDTQPEQEMQQPMEGAVGEEQYAEDQMQNFQEGHPVRLQVSLNHAIGLNQANNQMWCKCVVLHTEPKDVPQECATQTVAQTLEPVWNETFELEWNVGDALEFSIWDKDFSERSKPEGEATMVSSDQFFPNGLEGDLPINGLENAFVNIRIVPLVDPVPGAEGQPQASVKQQIGDWLVCEDAQGEFYSYQPTGQTFDAPPPELVQLFEELQQQS